VPSRRVGVLPILPAALALELLEKSVPSDLLGLLRFSIHLALLPIGGTMPRDEEPRARSLRLSSQAHIYAVAQDVVSTGLTKGGITRGFLGR
jgi:hypothetical protein